MADNTGRSMENETLTLNFDSHAPAHIVVMLVNDVRWESAQPERPLTYMAECGVCKQTKKMSVYIVCRYCDIEVCLHCLPAHELQCAKDHPGGRCDSCDEVTDELVYTPSQECREYWHCAECAPLHLNR